MFRAIAIACVLSLFAVEASAQTTSGKLQGVWKLVELKTGGPNGTTNSNPQPGMTIFTAKHYSVVRVTSAEPRPALPADLEKATASELRAVWGPFNANTGTYELVGDKLTQYPIVAKGPDVMAQGAKIVNSVKLDGNTLWLTFVSNTSGPITNPPTLKYVRVE